MTVRLEQSNADEIKKMYDLKNNFMEIIKALQEEILKKALKN